MFMHRDGGDGRMDLLQIMLWLVYPYTVVAILGMGLIWKGNDPLDQEEGSSIKKGYQFLNRTTIGLMIMSFLTGVGVILFNNISNDPQKLFHWVKSLVYLEPDMELIKSISVLSRSHFLLLLTFLLILPFSKYIKYIWPLRLLPKQKWSKNTTNIG